MPTEPINPADGRLQGREVGMELIMEEAIVRQRDNNGYKFPNRYREAFFPSQNVRVVVVGDTEGPPKCLVGVRHQMLAP